MTLRDRLEGKARRRHVHRILVDDPAAAGAALQDASLLLLAAERPGADPEGLAAAQAAHAAAQAAYAACFEAVEFLALPGDEYEALVAEHIDDDGDLDTAAVLPHLAAACAVPQDLADATWWAGQLASDRWSAGERDDLYHALYLLNRAVPGPGPGKG